MLKYDQLSEDQLNLVDRLYEHDTTLVYATMGSGKTVCTMTAIKELIEEGILNRVLVVAPLKPAREVWGSEHKLWEHLEGLDIAMAIGNPEKRKAAIESNSPIVVINIENLAWFCDTFKQRHNFDGLVLDELSKFKDNSAKVVKKLRYRTHDFKWKVGLTGSPVHEGYDGLFAQMLVLDGGETYGRNKEKFLQKYFYPTDYEQRNWEVRENMRAPLLDALKHVWYSMPDYTHELPPVHEVPIRFQMLHSTMQDYKTLKKHSVLDDIVAENAAVLSGKLEQLASGFIYDGDEVIDFEDGRRRATFKGIRQRIKAPCLVFYTFEEEKNQIIRALGDDYMMLDEKGAKDAWNSGKVNNLLLHPKSAGHGLNLQHGGNHLIWYSPIWSNDMFKQAIARLWRRGQKQDVYSYELICEGTVDELKIQRVEDKQEHDRLLREHFTS